MNIAIPNSIACKRTTPPVLRGRCGGGNSQLYRSSMGARLWELLNTSGQRLDELSKDDRKLAMLCPKDRRPRNELGFRVERRITKDKEIKDRVIANDEDNVRLALIRLGIFLRYDEFNDQIIIEEPECWVLDVPDPERDPVRVLDNPDNFKTATDALIQKLWFDIDREFHFRPDYDFFFKVITNEARRTTVHPVRDYLDHQQARWVPPPPALLQLSDEEYDQIVEVYDPYPNKDGHGTDWKAVEQTWQAWLAALKRNGGDARRAWSAIKATTTDWPRIHGLLDEEWPHRVNLPRSSLDTWLIDLCGADDTPFNRAVGALMLIAAVRRVRQPGCKFDEMPVLEGPQGKGKSTALSVLAVDEEWFSDALDLTAKGKEVLELSAGKWIVECAELSGLRRSDIEHMKSLLSRQADRARMAYDRLISERPRQFIFVGTTNEPVYLQDETGNRRFLPVKITQVDIEGLRRQRDALWAEAAYREAHGESIRLPKHLWEDARIEQEKRVMSEPWAELLGEVLGDLNGKIAQSDLWDVLSVKIDRQDKRASNRLRKSMEALGFKKAKLRIDGALRQCYVRHGQNDHHQIKVMLDMSSETAAADDGKGKFRPGRWTAYIDPPTA